MKKSHLLGLVLAGFLLAGCFHTGLKNQTGVTTTQPVEPSITGTEATEATGEAVQVEEGTTVRYTDTGFVPQSISVIVGDSVTFVNESGKQMWVASAVHPTHQVLPGFDQLTAVGMGESYTYTFEMAGQWKYHNHVSPGDTGVVVVE
ncbi:MAG: hypothetical protein A3F04_00135 [Candidatus Chisholmbacteria bacterium RIFCSPHIGHO2_12_FULL_49_9]|uniref:EfeO-type cupredoxin-like domain-containing protein n=1 Tax=Candidatus Chisholmbacteria bacterium RIFCSPHIGHO2_01_FULL_52_32 TaxID=1797591 RepID=A0A1G1VSS9_9BACT|nr:MAG: hypothetical protein A2786_01975 [Candidatus Chisholmbacteria bacterium RIFCSPHIGHO2_01_FULL_52_32]OGY19124.1 MAG: hypothetical protein A3F04_00135 [Candidatus Chisholmbacteria bacterium RIFCSPHIGHO2_12_FULL_49_9]OGY20360.1 MAG: hypothetical protein A2900_04770 [Candidatus Chisholmbacteria bacterium RIFCSPLOWO2_01_FULL_50_28]